MVAVSLLGTGEVQWSVANAVVRRQAHASLYGKLSFMRSLGCGGRPCLGGVSGHES